MIECVPVSRMDDEILFWIGRSDFYRWFDQKDFLCRNRQEVEPAYLTEWFRCRESDGVLTFEAPAIKIFGGRTEFFSGRHRTEVLFKYLDLIPFALKPISNDESWPFVDEHRDDSLRLFESIPKRPCSASDRLFVPDLSIWKIIPKDGDGVRNPIHLSRWAVDPKVRREMASEGEPRSPCNMTVEVKQGDGSFSVCIKSLA